MKVIIQLEDDGYEYEVPLALFLKIMQIDMNQEEILQRVKEAVKRV